jgi:hypothetical protein
MFRVGVLDREDMLSKGIACTNQCGKGYYVASARCLSCFFP